MNNPHEYWMVKGEQEYKARFEKKGKLNMDDDRNTSLIKESLEDGLCHIFGRTRVVKQVNREVFHGSSSFATEKIKVLLDEEEWIHVFFKDLNPCNLLDEAQKIREAGFERSRREFFMYQRILAPLNLGTPTLYGYRWDPGQGFYWLFLEDAGPKRLSRLGDFYLWVEAARWVAKLHALDPNQWVNDTDFIPRYDSEHFTLCGRRIEENMDRFDPKQRHVIFLALTRYHKVFDYLVSLPPHLIHGEYFGKNVMIRPGEDENKIAVIDWETAAFGPRCVDLVSITAGRWTKEQRDAMCKAYADQYASETGHPVDMESLKYELQCIALYRAIWWLGYWAKGDEAHINRWIRELETVMF